MDLPESAILYLSDNRGQYIPMDFARDTYRDCITGVSAEDLDILACGPPGSLRATEGASDAYWDIWDDVCRNARITDKKTGTVYSIYQDGDCWLIPIDAVWPEDEIDG